MEYTKSEYTKGTQTRKSQVMAIRTPRLPLEYQHCGAINVTSI
jgi:hypothetical protein